MPNQQLFEPVVLRSEISGLNACFSDLRQNGPAFQARASARFTLLMHDWVARCPNEEPFQKHHREAIQRVVNLMHSRLDTPFDVPALAQAAGLGERRFRQVFSLLTGKSPKRFYEELRLRKAADHLRFGAGNVSETADKFGYSSPFHFSKAFRNLFGVSPMHYLSTLSNTTRTIRG